MAMEHRKVEKQLQKEKNFVQGPEAKTGVSSHTTILKKERSFVRHSFHHPNYASAGIGLPNNGGQTFVRDFQMKRRSVNPTNQGRHKPAMELYKPPTMRNPSSFDYSMTGYQYSENMIVPDASYDTKFQPTENLQKFGLNINAKEFVSFKNNIQHSKSAGNVTNQGKGNNSQGLKSGADVKDSNSPPYRPPTKVHFNENKENETTKQMKPAESIKLPAVPPGMAIKRSKSLGAGDLRLCMTFDLLLAPPDLGHFSPQIQELINKAFSDPSSLSGRQVMELARHIFVNLTESTRHAEPSARLCIALIEKEKGETFLETLLNTCQEYFQERGRLLRNCSSPHPNIPPSHPKWIAYMTFLNEMYTQLKRRQVQLMTQRMRNNDTPPGLLLLTLLAQCCTVCLREPAVNSLPEAECLFFVLTGVGKDIELELPNHMTKIMATARDAFITRAHVAAVRKTLLQLIEMHAAHWQLPASAVLYYYPAASIAK